MDIHATDYEKRYGKAVEGLQPRDSELILKFAKQKRAEDISGRRLVKILYSLKAWRKFLPDKRWEELTKDDIVDAVGKLNQCDYAENTKIDLKKILKSFFKFIKNSKYPPEEVDWIVCERKKNKQKVKPDIITHEDLRKLIDTSENLMEKCFISMIWESGARIGELLPIKISDIARERIKVQGADGKEGERVGFRLKITGKTGARSPLVMDCASLIDAWLRKHPNGSNPNEYFFYWNRGGHISYSAVRGRLASLFSKAGVSKKCNPHNFRHSSATYKAKMGWTLPQLCTYHGWELDSREAKVYINLVSRDVDDAVLKLNGNAEKAESPVCHECGADINTQVKEELEMLKEQLKLHQKILEKLASTA